MTQSPSNARIGTVRGVFLRPTTSLNNRKYTPETIAKAVGRMQAKIANGGIITMATSHGAADKDDALATVARITKVGLLADHSATFEAEIANTAAGRDIANLVNPSNPFIKGVSIRGQWLGDLSTENSANGLVTVGSDLDIMGIDFTHRPGVDGAGITSALIGESVGNSRFVFEEVSDVGGAVTIDTPAVLAPTLLASMDCDEWRVVQAAAFGMGKRQAPELSLPWPQTY